MQLHTDNTIKDSRTTSKLWNAYYIKNPKQLGPVGYQGETE